MGAMSQPGRGCDMRHTLVPGQRPKIRFRAHAAVWQTGRDATATYVAVLPPIQREVL
jgi:hypothetical protein